MAKRKDGEWGIGDSAKAYQIRGWGEPYFRINDAGHIEVSPDPSLERGIDLHELTSDLEARGLQLPLLIRFPQILADRIRLLNECFQRAVDEYEYKGRYQGVYPIKVNQQRHLVEEVVRFGKPYSYGLEVGSKPELLIALAVLEGSDGLLICNGYKDRKYVETALVARQLNHTVILVLERIEELDLVLEASQRTGIKPILGVRAKLSAKGTGRWADSAGDRAKFGLTSAEMVEVVDRLREHDQLDALQLLHFHIGSQISSITPVKSALREGAQYFVELTKMGANMRYFDVGGGLAVDYDGSRSDYHASKNYELREYANDVVFTVQEACERAEIEPPTLVTEAGRAVAAYQSILVFEVLGSNEPSFPAPQAPSEDAHTVLHELYDTWKGIVPKNVQEAWHDALAAREEARSLFKFGYLDLRDRAHADRLFWHCGKRIMEQGRRLRFVPEELDEVEAMLGTIYYCNFSVFQSAPDSWAIDQLFPILPIHRLEEEPTERARLADVTCDSDGIVDNFIDVEEVKHVLNVHKLKEDEPYRLGMFLNGAYQEILGDLHNLFGDTHAIHVRIGARGYEIDHVIKGDSMNEVLRYVAYDPENMVECVRRQVERARSEDRITLPQMRLFMDHYEESLRSYTYLTDE